jgi:5'-deoxynucleotidase YfbR-like HD superfamily hydrolase
MSQAWIETYSGLQFDILEPHQETINIVDIAHALSQLCRFTGHTKYMYTVGQHSLLASYLVPEEEALAALLHDASEAYIGDVNRPLKHYTDVGKTYLPIEDRIMRAVFQRFGVTFPFSINVKHADDMMLYAEKAQLMNPIEWQHKWGDSTEAANIKIHKMSSHDVEDKFLERFHQLYKIGE